MIKKVIDTNIFIDRFSSPDLYRGIFLSSGIVYLSSIVLMELRAGVHTKQAVRAIDEMFDFFRQVGRIIVPSITDYEKAGEIISKLQVSKGYTIRKSASFSLNHKSMHLECTPRSMLKRFDQELLDLSGRSI